MGARWNVATNIQVNSNSVPRKLTWIIAYFRGNKIRWIGWWRRRHVSMKRMSFWFENEQKSLHGICICIQISIIRSALPLFLVELVEPVFCGKLCPYLLFCPPFSSRKISWCGGYKLKQPTKPGNIFVSCVVIFCYWLWQQLSPSSDLGNGLTT